MSIKIKAIIQIIGSIMIAAIILLFTNKLVDLVYSMITKGKDYFEFVYTSPIGYFTLSTTSIFILFLTVIFMKATQITSDLSFLNLFKKRNIKYFVCGFLLSLISILIYVPLGVVSGGLSSPRIGLQGFTLMQLALYTMSSFLLGFFGAVAEEIFFRYFMVALLKRISNNQYLVILITAIIFIPSNLYSGMKVFDLLTVICTGLLLGFLYVKTNNIWITIGFHFCNHFVLENIVSIIHNPMYHGPILVKFDLINNVISNNSFIFGNTTMLFVCCSYIMTILIISRKDKKNEY